MKTYYQNQYSKPVSNMYQYIQKIESLIFMERATGVKGNINLLFLRQKLKNIHSF